MEIKMLKIGDIKPYEKNPRKNDASVEYVANSIKEFGFKVPIVIDKNNVIVTGHTRYKAGKKLGLKEVPCIMADDLTDEQIKAYRLADNKVGESSEWDFDLLDGELADILTIDMEQFDFDLPTFDEEIDEEEEPSYYGDERERTYKKNNFDEYDEELSCGFYDMPTLEPVDYIPKDLISFNYVLSAKETNTGVHFYIDDYQFERVWDRPQHYIERLSEFDCVLTPDFSLYTDMPMAMKIWNVYRSRMVGQIMQKYGLTVIPTLQWAEKETFNFCFDGIKGGTVSVSTIGVKGDKEKLKLWADGMDEAIKRIHPSTILVYGGKIDYDFKNINVVYYENKTTERMASSGK